MPYLRNPGRIPPECEIRDEQGNITGWRKVHVRTFGGWDSRKAGHEPWPAGGGRPPTKWKVDRPPHSFDIQEYEVI